MPSNGGATGTVIRMDDPRGEEIEDLLALLAKAAESLNQGDSDSATDIAQALLEIEELPDALWAAALTIRGQAALSEGLLPDALEDLDNVLEVAPEDPQALVVRGYIQKCMGMIEEAEADYERALDLDPDGEHGRAAVDLLTALRDGDDEAVEAWAVGEGRPLVSHEEPWGVITLPDCWELRTEPLDPPASRWTTGDVDLDLMVAGAVPTGETSLDEVFEEVVSSTSQAIQELFDTRDVVHSREQLGGLAAHLVTATSTVPLLVLASVILAGPTQVLSVRLLDHRPGAEPDSCVKHLMSLLEGTRLPA